MSRYKKRGKKKTTKGKRKTSRKVLSKNQKYLLLGLLSIAFLAYIPLLGAEFINYDDDLYITENPHVRFLSGDGIKTLFSSYFWNQYSPIAMVIMALEIKIFGLNPLPLKFISILIHLINTFLVFQFVKILFKKYEYALIAAAVFALHPLQVESVAWLTASMKIGTYSLFSLASYISYITWLDQKKKPYYYYSILAFLLACFCKEQAISLPAVIILIDYVRSRNIFEKNVLFEKVPYLIIALIFAAVTLGISGEQQNVQMVDYFNPVHRFIFSCVALSAYLVYFILPIQLSPFYTYPLKSAIPVYYYLTPLIAAGLIIGIYLAWKKNNRIIVFAILFFLANIFLTLLSQVLSVRDVMMADRYVYLPLTGIGIALGYLLEQILKNRPAWKPWPIRILIIFGVFFTTLTFARSKVWENSITIFGDAIEKGTKPGQINPYLVVAFNN
ncbi:MAG: glycosyltransferase family 39 protein, partial [Saprospiraceae bacterium]|nr:glycosyltransferase family 39 protein [Saprospiraceae bacterium]